MSSLIKHAGDGTQIGKRNVQDVPFVELHDGKLQGVVSSGSSAERVYIAFIKAGSHDFHCSTNNNRRCGGIYGTYCKHIRWLLAEAVKQYGPRKVAEYLQVSANPDQVESDKVILSLMHGSEVNEPNSAVFSRFLTYLRYIEKKPMSDPLPEMVWFL